MSAVVSVDLPILHCDHTVAACRTFHKPGQEAYPLRISNVFILPRRFIPLSFCPVPVIFGNDRLMFTLDTNGCFRIFPYLLGIRPAIVTESAALSDKKYLQPPKRITADTEYYYQKLCSMSQFSAFLTVSDTSVPSARITFSSGMSPKKSRCASSATVFFR